MHIVYEFHKKIQLRSRDVIFNKGKLNLNQPSSSLQNDDKNKEKPKEQVPCKEPMNKGEKTKEFRPPSPMEIEKDTPTLKL